MRDKIKRFLHNIICSLYYKHCFKRDKLSSHLLTYYIPDIMKDGTPVTGTYLFGFIENSINHNNIEVWSPPAGVERGKIDPILSVNLNVESYLFKCGLHRQELKEEKNENQN